MISGLPLLWQPRMERGLTDMKKRFLKGDVLFSLLTLAISIIFFIASFQYHGMKGDSGPGTFPRMISVVTGVLSLVLMIQSFISTKEKPAAEEDTSTRREFWLTLILIALYLASWQYVHFIICTIVFLLLMSRVLKLPIVFSVIYSAVFAVGIYFIFANVFHILL